MKISSVLVLLASSITVGDSITFTDRKTPLFGVIPRGGSKQTAVPTEEEQQFERASKAILSGIATVEDQVQKAVAAEVDTLFHKLESADPAKKAKVHEKAKKAVEKGVSKVKSHVEDEHKKQQQQQQQRGDAATASTTTDRTFPYEVHNPYEWPSYKSRGNLPHGDSRILQAVEAAERAVIHAVEQEVDTLFHETEHHHHEDGDDNDKEHKKQTKEAVKAGLKSTKKKVQDTQEHRREWLVQEGEAARVEDYIRFAME